MSRVTMPMPSTVSGSSGEVASYVEGEREKSYSLLQRSTALGLVPDEILRQLAEVFSECSHKGWDGASAEPLTEEVLQSAVRFLCSFPVRVEVPEVGAEPDGSMTLEWYRSPNRVLSVSIGPDGWMYWAALLGTVRRQGAEYAGMGAPDDLVRIILQVTEGN